MTKRTIICMILGFLYTTACSSQKEKTVHFGVEPNRVELVRNGVKNSVFFDVSYLSETDVDVTDVVDKCMEIQRLNPPKPLSPMEIMRRNATKHFSARPAVVMPQKKQEPQAEVENGEQIFDVSSLKIVEGSKNPEKELEKIIGMEKIKHELLRMRANIEFQNERAAQQGYIAQKHSGHMCFMGPPGTGKTMIARLITGVLYEMKMINKNQCIEISGLDMLGNYTGQTAIISQKIVDAAKGGVLFIDEAYAIVGSAYGSEAVGVLLKEMEDNCSDLVVIFAGYEKDMNRLLGMNEGFRSRVNRYFTFENYKIEELAEIFMLNLRSRNLLIERDALEASLKAFGREINSPVFGNGRYVRNFTEKIEDSHIENRVGIDNLENLNVIVLEDVIKGAK